MRLNVSVCTSDKYTWALRGFAYLFNVYWSALQPVDVVGYSPPDFELPENFRFHSIRTPEYPQGQWSNGLIEYLRGIEDELLVLMLDDYWLCRTADVTGVGTLADYMLLHPEVLRMDLTTDRLYAGGMFEVESFGHYDVVETSAGTPYQMSLQAGIWRRRLLLDVLKPERSPWQVEIETSPPAAMRVLGSRQWPVRYANVFRGGNPAELLNLKDVPGEHRAELETRGWLHP